MKEVLNAYDFKGTVVDYFSYGNGHINDTYKVLVRDCEGTELHYIIQRMNHNVFKDPWGLVNNIHQVTSHIKKKIEKRAGDTQREVLQIIPTKEGQLLYTNESGEYWRAMNFIENANCFEKVERIEDFYESALAFGQFQAMLSDFDASLLTETIPGFHNTKQRYQTFLKAVEEDTRGRAALVQEEINFLLERKEDAYYLSELLEAGKIPLRVTHNDTKLNNVMMDHKTGKGICVIDLDTVMPGLSIFDFGDAIRFGANTGAEDEVDLTKISCDLELFHAFAKGFMQGCGGKLTQVEIDLLPMGAKIMTLECGMRFLTDYLQGDVYFKTHRDGHNLDRCRTQFELVRDMERKWNTLSSIIKELNI